MVNSNRRLSAQFGLRMPEEMRAEIARIAEANNRSMNAEIVARLERSLATTDETNIMVLDIDTDGYADAILSVNGKNYSFRVKEAK